MSGATQSIDGGDYETMDDNEIDEGEESNCFSISVVSFFFVYFIFIYIN